MTYRDKSSGGEQTITNNLYGYTFTLNSAKTVESITLPNNSNVQVLALHWCRDCFWRCTNHSTAIKSRAGHGTWKAIIRKTAWNLFHLCVFLCRILTFTMLVETEIKFRVDDLAGLTQRLQAAGFTLKTPRAFESNVLYDTPGRQMRARTEILRIRGYAGRWTVTHKRLPDAGPSEDRHKHRIETETEVADGATLAEIFLSLGLVPSFRYEKWRAEWQDGEGHCVVDETPIGNYAELEGSAEWIDRAAARLGIDPVQYITLSYGRLFDLWRNEHHSTAEDLTFAAIAEGRDRQID